MSFASAALCDSASHSAADEKRMLADLSTAERNRHAAMRRTQPARQYLGSRWLLRQHLSVELGVAPVDVPLVCADDAAPALAGWPHRIGLSHSHTVCLCIVAADVPVGCDLERVQARPRDALAIAIESFHPLEESYLAATDSRRRLSDFYRLWTLKEAGRKALSQGISHGLHTPAFSLTPVFQCQQPLDLKPWTFAAGAVAEHGEKYALALAVGALTDSVALLRYEPGLPGRAITIDWSIAQSA